MPIVKDGEIVFTIEGPKVYYNIVLELIKMELTLKYDDPDFLRLMVDHVQMFERHWRKMVADIRMGKLDRKLDIPTKWRERFESTNIPRPTLAKKLDSIFRQLGFHKKVLGADINIVPHASLRHPKDKLAAARARRPSLPYTPQSRSVLRPGTGAEDSLSLTGPIALSSSTCSSKPLSPLRGAIKRDGGPSSPAREGGSQRLPGESVRSRPLSPLGPLSLSTLGDMATDTASAAASLSPEVKKKKKLTFTSPRKLNDLTSTTVSSNLLVSSSLDASTSAATKRPMSKRQMLQAVEKMMKSGGLNELREQEQELQVGDTFTQCFLVVDDHNACGGHGCLSSHAFVPLVIQIRAPSRQSRGDKRRGSDTDIFRATQPGEVHASFYQQDSAPRAKYDKVVEDEMGERYICPFPACGKSYRSQQECLSHLKVHEQRMRLSASTPMQDAHMSYYWPEGAPWLDAAKYTERALPPGSCACPFEGCHEVFSTKERLVIHVRRMHAIVGPSSVFKGFFKMEGACTHVPPHFPPTGIPLPYCVNHFTPFPMCVTCVDLEKAVGRPKPPYKVYSAVAVDFSAKKGTKDRADVRRLGNISDEFGVQVSGDYWRGADANTKGAEMNGARAWFGAPVAMVVDHEDNGWVYVRRLLNQAESRNSGQAVPADFDKAFEVVEAKPTATDEGAQWVLMQRLVGYSAIVRLEKEEFYAKLAKKEIGRKNVFFIRP